MSEMTFTTALIGLVRAAEILEERDGGQIWDDTARKSREWFKSLGWDKGAVGVIPEELLESNGVIETIARELLSTEINADEATQAILAARETIDAMEHTLTVRLQEHRTKRA